MAIKIKANKKKKDKHGNEYSNAYAVIDNVVTDKLSKYHKIKVRIFKDKQARDNKFSPVEVVEHCATGTDFDTYFSPAAITLDDNQYVQSYLYILQMTTPVITIVNEVEVITNELVYGDWESDI